MAAKKPKAKGSSGPCRMRFDGKPEDVVAALKPFATIPDFIQYPEVMEAPQNKNLIEAAGPLIRALFKIHPKMCFSDGFMKTVFSQLAAECAVSVWARALTPFEDEHDNNVPRGIHKRNVV